MIDRICNLVDRMASELILAILIVLGIFGAAQFEAAAELIKKVLAWLTGAGM